MKYINKNKKKYIKSIEKLRMFLMINLPFRIYKEVLQNVFNSRSYSSIFSIN